MDLGGLGVATAKKFAGDNYRQWRFQTTLALKARGLGDHITSSDAPATSDPVEWKKDAAKAMYVITASMELPQISLIETCETATEIFRKLDSIYDQKSENSKLLLHEKFHTIKFTEGDSIAETISRIENIAKQLKDAGETISEMAIVTKILGSLPERYRMVRQAWLSLEPSKQTVINLTARLLDEELSFKAQEETALATDNGTRKSVKCFKCNKKGHYARDCRFNSQRSNGNKHGSNYERNESAFIAQLEANFIEDEEMWILDSGASSHMTYRRNYFSNFKPEFSCVRLGDKSELSVQGSGSINIKKFLNGKWFDSTINNVLYVPELKRNLFSEGVVTSKGFSVTKNKDSAFIKNSDGSVAATAIKQPNNLYKLLFKSISVDGEANVVTLKQWHDRLGHVNIKTLREMVRNEHLPSVSDLSDFFCEACVIGKQHRVPFKKSSSDAEKNKVYSDLCGPMPTPSIGGARYFITFLDAASGFITVYILKRKSEARQAFQKYVQLLENKFDTKVKLLHSDNGKEYCNEEFRRYAAEKGIELEYTAPYTPQQNGRSERANRTIMESARSMLYARHLPLALWAEAVQAAVYLINRRCNKEKTPFEFWTGSKPTLTHVRTFGSAAYMHIPKEKRNKLEPKSKKLILVGYEGNSDNYRLFDPDTKKITVSRDVTFNENELSSLTDSMGETSEYAFDLDFGCHSERGTPIESYVYDYEAFEDFYQTMVNEVAVNEEVEIPECREESGTVHNENNERKEKRYNLRPRLPKITVAEANLVEVLPSTYTEAVNSQDKERWIAAMNEELDSHDTCETWELVEHPADKKLIGCKWVYKIKQNADDTTRYKARLCAKGYTQEKGIDYGETFSPTVRYDTIRMMLSLAAKEKLKMTQFDIKTAFLYGTLDEEIYMDPPPGVDTELVCKLNKSLYGLKQSPRCWNSKFHSFMEENGFVNCQNDKCLYVSLQYKAPLYLLLFVDDGLCLCKSQEFIDKFVIALQTHFEITIMSPKQFVGLEIEIERDGSIFVHQTKYINSLLDKFRMNLCKPSSVPADPNVKLDNCEGSADMSDVPYREAVGSLMYAAIGSRPDIHFIVCSLSRYLNNFSNVHWGALKKVFKYLKTNKELGILYSASATEDSSAIGFCDADYANCTVTRRSVTGYVFVMNGGAITWNTKLQKCVALSTTEAEYLAACAATKELVWIKSLMKEIGFSENIKLIIDNQSTIKLIRGANLHKRSKHIDIQYHYVRDKFLENVMDVEYCETKLQAADMFTKSLPKPQFESLRGMIGMCGRRVRI